MYGCRWIVLALVWFHCAVWGQWQSTTQPGGERYRSDQVQARLLAHAPQGFAAGAPVWLGVELTHAPEWHTYWRNSGDSGLPTEIQWQLPSGWQAEALIWPTPKTFSLGPLGNYGYDGQVLLSAPLRIAAPTPSSPVTVGAQVSWLACKAVCIPETAHLSLRIDAQSPIIEHEAIFRHHQARAPQDSSLQASMRVVGQELVIDTAALAAPWRNQPVQAYPETPGLIIPGAPTKRQWQADGSLQLRLALNPERDAAPQQVDWVLAVPPQAAGMDAPQGLRLHVRLQGAWPATVAPPSVAPALAAALAQPAPAVQAAAAQPSASYAWYWLLAMIGGVLLNLMPCVFPVLAIKVLTFTQNDDLRSHRASGLAYSAGVVLSFVALAAVLLALRQAGQAVGWGFQLQQPSTIAALALLFTLIALNLLGWVDVKSVLPARWAGVRLRHPVADAAWSGVLATAVASPCTAPFMGAALGVAITLPTPAALGLFAAVGLGMALPVLLVGWFPALGRWLPGPGAWMISFKEFMAFPMLATVVWLLWVLAQQTGSDGASALLLLLLAVAWLLWLLRRSQARVWHGLGALIVAGAAWALWPIATQPAPPVAQAVSAEWQTWSAQRQNDAVNSGQRVFVDFTAAWCVTCQVNELGPLRDARVLRAFESGRWLRLRADWTRQDADITRALNDLQRTGVPTYAVYHPGQAPLVLSELLRVDQLLEALQPR